jgi:hypothetical protein
MVRTHFLHFYKTGGTSIKAALRGRPGIVLHPHAHPMCSVPAGEAFFFSLRDPVERAVSGFHSRMRRGMPAHPSPWTTEERGAFTTYQSMEALAADLASPKRHARASQALDAIAHTASRYWRWLGDGAAFQARLADVFCVLFLPDLDAYLPRFFPGATVPRLHVAPPAHAERVSTGAVAVLRKHYAADYACLRAVVDTVPSDKVSAGLLRYAEAGFPTYWRP